MMHRFLSLSSLATLSLLLASTLSASLQDSSVKPCHDGKPVPPKNHEQKRLIIDTDIFEACDDVAALSIANLYHSKGLIDLLGVIIDTTPRWGAPAVSVINTFYGHPHIPIGALKPVTNDTYVDHGFGGADFTKGLYTNFSAVLSAPIKDGEDALDPVKLYRKLLSGSPDGSVTVVSIGFLRVLDGLLNSTADGVSGYWGRELVRRKVKELVVAGGAFPSGSEYNFFSYPDATARVINTWPGEITYSGLELGGTISTGAILTKKAPESNPFRAAWIAYNGPNTNAHSWDPVTMLYAMQGLGSLFSYGNVNGSNLVHANGSNVWEDTVQKAWPQHYLKLSDHTTNTTVADFLDGLYLAKA